MKVQLLKAVLEGRSVKTVIKNGREPVVFVKDAIIEMSDASAAKYIEQGLAKLVDVVANEVSVPV